MKRIFIGIDFSKEKFDATAVITANGFIECAGRQYESFDNNVTGFRKFITWTSRVSARSSKEDILFCGENTGTYSEFISDMLYVEGYTMWLDSALRIKKSMGIQRGKSDKADSAMIAEYAMRFQDRAKAYEPLKESLRSLQELFMYRAYLVKEKTAFCHRQSEKRKLESVKTSTKRFMERSSDMIVNRMKKEIAKCDKEMLDIINQDEELKEIYEIITSMKGFALQNAAAMMVYTNNFSRFDLDARKLACYYGVAPFGKDSGTSVHVSPHTSKFAHSMLKSLLSEAAQCAVIYCPEMRAYYERLKARGKKPMVAINNVKNKIIHIIVAMVRNKQKYNPNWQNCICSKTALSAV